MSYEERNLRWESPVTTNWSFKTIEFGIRLPLDHLIFVIGFYPYKPRQRLILMLRISPFVPGSRIAFD